MNLSNVFTAFAITLCLFSLSAHAGWRDWVDDIFTNAGGIDATALSETEIMNGLKAALEQGADLAVSQLGRNDGYWSNPQVKIPLPDTLSKGESMLRRIGLGSRVDDFHLSLNRAAEKAAPEALSIVRDAVRNMTLEDARSILNGGQDAATQYLRRSSDRALFSRFKPVVSKATNEAGVTQSYKRIESAAGPMLQTLGQEPQDLDSYVTRQGLEGLYTLIAAEEGRIRNDPVARGSEILKKVFGNRRQ